MDLNVEQSLADDDDFEAEPWHASELLRELHALRAVSNAQPRPFQDQ
jgi:hypothetical protein